MRAQIAKTVLITAIVAVATPALARVNPLRVITERRIRPEILVVLDTSGSPVPPGVTIGAIEYDDGTGTFSYPGSPDGDGFDPLVDAIRITLSGTFASVAPGGSPSFEVLFAARID